MRPHSERRHRLNPDEIEPVHDAALVRLRELVEVRDPGALDEAGSLFRIWYRIHFYVRNKPSYPEHGTYELINAQLPYGTVLPPREVAVKPNDHEEPQECPCPEASRESCTRCQDLPVWWFDNPEEAQSFAPRGANTDRAHRCVKTKAKPPRADEQKIEEGQQ